MVWKFIVVTVGLLTGCAGMFWSFFRRVRYYQSIGRLAQQRRRRAEQASAAKTRFLANMSHEIRTPLTGVLGMSELLLNTHLDAQQQGYVVAIQTAGEHLLRLVNDALDLAQIEAGKIVLDNREFRLQVLVDQVLSLSQPLAQQKQLECCADTASDVPVFVVGDANRVQQVLLNLMNNALKFTQSGGVGLSIERDHQQTEQVVFIVHDTGPGLDPGQCRRLFQRFEQVHDDFLGHCGGSGLGLAISQELVTAMNGTIRVHSTPGQGTQFCVSLPLLPVARCVPKREHQPSTQPTLRILLVENDPQTGETVRDLLQLQQHSVTWVTHGLAALTLLTTDRFDVCLCDLELPHFDGLALMAQLHRQKVDIPMIALVARAEQHLEHQARQIGYVGVIRQPVDAKMLQDAIYQAAQPRQISHATS